MLHLINICLQKLRGKRVLGMLESAHHNPLYNTSVNDSAVVSMGYKTYMDLFAANVPEHMIPKPLSLSQQQSRQVEDLVESS